MILRVTVNAMRRAILVGLVACGGAAAPDPVPRVVADAGIIATDAASDAVPPPDAASTVTMELPASAIAKLAGCWQSRQLAERWTFRTKGAHGLEIVREIADPSYAERARFPHDVMYDAAVGNFAFTAAGRIHAAMYVFVLQGDRLVADSYYSRVRGQYIPSGNTVTMVRC